MQDDNIVIYFLSAFFFVVFSIICLESFPMLVAIIMILIGLIFLLNDIRNNKKR
ncbi:hypothetical protein [Thermoanaerobacterium butyriciformans]|uniref:Uncharacterized protein n=1 Tax=Thermoanaerobacterium butyriciformans TaxID=1702242 RepID=A0ABS4NB50_9THEO|nr:hypothetical protein [Thermoanaerobacterium butyriciformans]MBP2070874.1 hypothetical protein [Thermoanaerobacterium butyriciformans]